MCYLEYLGRRKNLLEWTTKAWTARGEKGSAGDFSIQGLGSKYLRFWGLYRIASFLFSPSFPLSFIPSFHLYLTLFLIPFLFSSPSSLLFIFLFPPSSSPFSSSVTLEKCNVFMSPQEVHRQATRWVLAIGCSCWLLLRRVLTCPSLSIKKFTHENFHDVCPLPPETVVRPGHLKETYL